MSSRGRPLERTRSIEDLHELRLMALLHDLVRKHQRKGAGEMLGVDPRTVGACLERGALSKWMRTALEAQLLSREKAAMAAQQERIEALDQRMEALEHQITSGLGEMRTTMEGEIKALKDEHAGALRQLERRLAQVEAGVGNQRKWDTLRPERLEIGRGLGELPEGLVVAPSPFDCVSLHLLPALQYPFPPPVEHICRCHIAQRLVIAPVVVVGHEEVTSIGV